MSTTTSVEYNDMTLPEAIHLEEQLYEDLNYLIDHPYCNTAPQREQLQTVLTQVQDRIAHLTSLLTF